MIMPPPKKPSLDAQVSYHPRLFFPFEDDEVPMPLLLPCFFTTSHRRL
jgi:hypothetical protein